MSLAAFAAEAVEEEKSRRLELRRAIAESVSSNPEIDGVPVSLSGLRRHLRLYYGEALAYGATIADLAGAVAEIGGIMTSAGFVCIELHKPSREAMKRSSAKWNEGLPKGEIAAIRRLRQGHDDEAGKSEALPDGFVDIASLPEGSLYQGAGGVFRQVPPRAAAMVTRDGGDRRGHTITRKRRFPTYIEKLRAFLDREPGKPFAKFEAMISAVDRQILEHIVEGRSLRWIADEIGMKKATIHKRVAKIRRAAGISGPGPGR